MGGLALTARMCLASPNAKLIETAAIEPAAVFFDRMNRIFRIYKMHPVNSANLVILQKTISVTSKPRALARASLAPNSSQSD